MSVTDSGAGVHGGDPFRHEALLYADEDEFVARTSAFVRDGVEAGEPALVVVSKRKIERLREALGALAEGVHFADMSSVGRNPARIIPAWHEFVDRHPAPGARLRGIGEPISAERKPDELVECQRHESLLNLAFRGASGFWLVCPYDTSALSREVIAEARRSHPLVSFGDRRDRSPDYRDGTATDTLSAPLASTPSSAEELSFDEEGLEAVRRFIAERAAGAGLGKTRRVELVIAANEIASNSVRHGGGRGVLRMWRDPGALVCEIRDDGRIEDPLADRRLPSFDEPGGRGLWITNGLCDLVQVRSGPGGTVVRLHVARG